MEAKSSKGSNFRLYLQLGVDDLYYISLIFWIETHISMELMDNEIRERRRMRLGWEEEGNRWDCWVWCGEVNFGLILVLFSFGFYFVFLNI